MKQLGMSLFAGLLLFSLATTAKVNNKKNQTLPEQYEIDSAHSSLGFKVKHLGVSWVSGKFTKFQGSGYLSPNNNKVQKGLVRIDANSIDTSNMERDNHLKGPDFFDAKKHAKIKFEISKITTVGKKPQYILGDLTLKGIKKPIKLKVDEWHGAINAPGNKKKIAFRASGKINRRQFGLKWNKPWQNSLGSLVVGNDVVLTLDIQADRVQKKPNKLTKRRKEN